MAITIPELNSVNVVDDTDNIMLTHSNGNSEKISGAAFKADMIKNKIENNNGNAVSVNAVSTIMATSTTITGPELGIGGNIKILFTNDIVGLNTSTPLIINYNGSNKNVKVNKNGSLVNFVAANISSGVYKYMQAYTTLEMAYDGTQFIVIGNPVVISDTDYVIYANGKKIEDVVDVVKTGNMRPVTSNAVAESLSYSTTEQPIGAKWIDGKPIYRKVFDNLSFSTIGNGYTDTGVSISNMNIVIRAYGIRGTQIINFPSVTRSTSTQNIRVYDYDSWGNIDTLIIEYTKATD